MFLVGFLFVLLSLQGCFSAYVEVTPREAVVLPKESFNFLCKIGEAIQYCRIQINGIPSALNLSPLSQPTRGISYFGEGLESGQCGATIESIKEIHNGLINCSMGTATSSSESLASARLIVAKAPKAPELELNGGNDKLSEYKTGDQLYASCVVRDGRPAANISWYLDDVLITEKAIIPTIIDVAREDLYTTVQNISWRLQVSDHGKVLKCVAHHPTRYLNNQNSQVLKIIFPPQKNTDMMQQFGYKIGEPGEIRVDINANPKPKIEWTIGDQRIKEDMVDESGRYKAERLTDEGLGHYTARLTIAQISKEDTENTFHLTAYNDQGHAEYSVVISTNPEPQGIQIGYLAIIVVVVLLFILIVSLLIFARVTGRWCFSAQRERSHTAESSDTESAEVRQREKKLNFKNLGNVFKKNKDKVTHEDEYPKNMETDEEKQIIDDAEKQIQQPAKEGIVYAELDLVSPNLRPVVKNDDDKTEYAEIIYTKADADEENKPKDETKT